VALVGRSLLVPAALVIGLDLLFAGLASLNFSNVFAIDGVTAAAKLRMVQPILRVLGVVGLAAAGTVSILSLVGVNVVVSVTMFLLSSAVIRRRERPDWLGTRSLSRRELARYSAYYSASMSTNAVQNEGEKFVLATYRPAAEVGEYAAAYRVVQTSLLPMSALMGAASRWFMVKDERVGAQRLRAQRLSVVVAVYGVLVAAVILVGADIIQWVAGSEYTEVSVIAVWLMFFPLLHGLADIPPMGLLGLGRNRERMLMGFGTSVAAVVGYLALVPHLGWRGAVIGTYVSELAGIAAGWVLLVRYQKIADSTLADGASRSDVDPRLSITPPHQDLR
jgi:O-antigen/teichoic acid export membrane protein